MLPVEKKTLTVFTSFDIIPSYKLLLYYLIRMSNNKLNLTSFTSANHICQIIKTCILPRRNADLSTYRRLAGKKIHRMVLVKLQN